MASTFDLLGTVLLTLSAAIVSAALAVGFAATTTFRLRLLAGLAAWFGAVVALAATEAFNYEHATGTPGLGLAVALPIVILSWAGWRSERLHRSLDVIPLPLLIGVNVVRVFGVMFVLLHLAGRLPAPFAPAAGWGDVIAGVTALWVAWLAYGRGRNARPVVIAWNVFGLADLSVAIALGLASSPGPLHLVASDPRMALMSTLPWLLIPAFLVPLLALTHLAVFFRLRRTRPSARAAKIAA